MPSIIVHNQCSNFELISPAYFGQDITWHIPLDQKVDANTMTRISFKNNLVKHDFTAVLTYKLQRKNSYKSNNQSSTVDTTDASSLQLLVIWRSDYFHEFYVNVILIKHSSIIAWDEAKMKMIHHIYSDIIKRRGRMIEKTWLLDDDTVLMTTPRRGEEGCTLEIAISKGARKDDSIEPILISSSECDSPCYSLILKMIGASWMR
jgi:hypothetical protein